MESYVPPAERARKLLNDLGLKRPPIPVEEICGRLDIEYMYGANIDSEALIIKGCKRKKPLIAVKSNEQYKARVRFSVAHELGHFCIPSHLNETYSCSIEDLNHYQENKPVEKEANEFAAELLIPQQWITQAIKSQDVSMQLIKTLAEEYETSLTATALKVTTDCPDRIAVVYSNSGKAVWFKKSKTFNIHINTGKLSNLSLAGKLSQPTALYPEMKGAVPLEAWTYDIRNYEHLVEESLYMPYLNSVLTILMIPCDEFEEEFDEGE
jgi:Zn-dependent peptidase ImmA (M78 family)